MIVSINLVAIDKFIAPDDESLAASVEPSLVNKNVLVFKSNDDWIISFNIVPRGPRITSFVSALLVSVFELTTPPVPEAKVTKYVATLSSSIKDGVRQREAKLTYEGTLTGNGVGVPCRDLWLLKTLTAFFDNGTSLLVPFLVNGR